MCISCGERQVEYYSVVKNKRESSGPIRNDLIHLGNKHYWSIDPPPPNNKTKNTFYVRVSWLVNLLKGGVPKIRNVNIKCARAAFREGGVCVLGGGLFFRGLYHAGSRSR